MTDFNNDLGDLIFNNDDLLFDTENEIELKKINIRVFQRNGRKRITVIEDIPDMYNIKDIAKELRKKFNCSAMPKKGNIIKCSGDNRVEFKKWFMENLNINENDINIHGG